MATWTASTLPTQTCPPSAPKSPAPSHTRGIYENTANYYTAYDTNKPGYGATAEEWWQYYSARPWASGGFVWTGFDYRGPLPFGWPKVLSESGILDNCGFPKDVFYYYQSWWSDKVVLHLMPHWNWPGKEGQDIDVRCFSNCEEVELFLNGQSLGRKPMPKNSHLQWMVKYAPGTLLARGYKGGRQIAEDKVETAGAPAAIRLSPDRAAIRADGEDLAIIAVNILDSQGRLVPDAANLVHFALAGPGAIIGVGNGDPISHEPDVFLPDSGPRAGDRRSTLASRLAAPRFQRPGPSDRAIRQRPRQNPTHRPCRRPGRGHPRNFRPALRPPPRRAVRPGAFPDGWAALLRRPRVQGRAAALPHREGEDSCHAPVAGIGGNKPRPSTRRRLSYRPCEAGCLILLAGLGLAAQGRRRRGG